MLESIRDEVFGYGPTGDITRVSTKMGPCDSTSIVGSTNKRRVSAFVQLTQDMLELFRSPICSEEDGRLPDTANKRESRIGDT